MGAKAKPPQGGRKKAKAKRKKAAAKPPTKATQFVSVRVSPALLVILRRRAAAAGHSLSSWIHHELVESARDELLAE